MNVAFERERKTFRRNIVVKWLFRNIINYLYYFCHIYPEAEKYRGRHSHHTLMLILSIH